jgi:hypothetical protein
MRMRWYCYSRQTCSVFPLISLFTGVCWLPCLRGVSPHRDALLAAWMSSRRRCEATMSSVSFKTRRRRPSSSFLLLSRRRRACFIGRIRLRRLLSLQFPAQLASPPPCAPVGASHSASPHQSWPRDVVFLAHGQNAAVICLVVARLLWSSSSLNILRFGIKLMV